jgi:hypothetical protein
MVSVLLFLGMVIILSVLKSHGNATLDKYRKPVRWIIVLECLGIALTFGEIVYNKWFTPTEIERPKQGEGNLIESFLLEKEGEQQEVFVEIEEEKYSEEEALSYIEEAKQEIDETFLGENTSLDTVYSKVHLGETYADGRVEASWTFSPAKYVNLDGTINYEKLENPKEGTLVQVECELNCGDYGEIYRFPMSVWVADLTTKEGFQYYLEKSLAKMNEEVTEKVTLPEEIEGIPIEWHGVNSNRGLIISVMGIVALVGLLIGDKEEKRREKKRLEERMRMDYADIVEKLSLYVSAGIGIKNSFQRVLAQYDSKDVFRPGFEEVRIVCREMESGVSEVEAYEHLGQRAVIPEYRKLSLLILQNVKRGTEGLAAAFEKEEMEVFLMRKNRVRTAGEEASTKLIFPMMGLLVMVIVVMIVPALMNIEV